MNEAMAMELLQRAAPVTDQAIAQLNLGEAIGELLTEVKREPRTVPAAERELVFAPRRRSWLRTAVACLAVAASVTAIAVTPVGAKLRDLGSDLVDYLDGDDLPGQPINDPDEGPAWLQIEGLHDQRIIASSGGYGLFLAIQGGVYNFGVDHLFVLGKSKAQWEKQFADNEMVVIGASGHRGRNGLAPMAGVTAGNVAEVELRYEDGTTVSTPTETDGFVLLYDPYKHPVELTALAADGTVLQTQGAGKYGANPPEHHDPRDVTTLDNTVYLDENGNPVVPPEFHNGPPPGTK